MEEKTVYLKKKTEGKKHEREIRVGEREHI